MSPINFGGDSIQAITFDGDDIQEVTMDGDVVFTSGPEFNFTVLEDFESYDTQSQLENEWTIATSPTRYLLQETGALEGSQNIRTSTNTAHCPNPNIATEWGESYSAGVYTTNPDGSPGILVQHQDATNRLDDCYWIRIDSQNGTLDVYERVNGNTANTLIREPASTGTGAYRIRTDFQSGNDLRIRLYDFDEGLGASPIADTGSLSPNTVHSGGHFAFTAGRSASVNHEVFDYVIRHE